MDLSLSDLAEQSVSLHPIRQKNHGTRRLQFFNDGITL